jgi:hypothetical protein
LIAAFSSDEFHITLMSLFYFTGEVFSMLLTQSGEASRTDGVAEDPRSGTVAKGNLPLKRNHRACRYANQKRFGKATRTGGYLGLVPHVDISGSLVQRARTPARSKAGGALKERREYVTKAKGKGGKKAARHPRGSLGSYCTR